MQTTETGIIVPQGQIIVYRINEATGEKVELFSQPNLVMYQWGNLVARAFGQADTRYALSGFYLEYYNAAHPGDLVTVPSYTRADGLSYYTGLSSPGDYLRVPVSGLPSITVSAGYGSYFTGSDGNTINAFGQSSGTVGQLGRPFAAANNSTIFGIAIIATPNWLDPSQDRIFARTYFSTSPNNQQLKTTGYQIGVTWQIPLL